MTNDYLRQRARRGSRAKYDAALAEVPDVEPEAHDCLEEAVARLDPAEEAALAEEGLAADLEVWPEYAAELANELDRRLEDRAVNPGLGRSWPEVKARLLDPE
ncbi:MAG TPA: hypothetical protein VHG08_01480 [Longimicrobium sp.]|nr:hypothetical protein [Longimicrobium sp.]